MKVFSFCIYGNERNYYDGLLENIRIIREYFPDFEIYVYKGICDPSWVFEDCKVIETERDGAINMLYRYLPLTFADIGFVRDADSRVYERDRWCIAEFLNSSKNYHLVRDHFYHKEPIMGGIFGWKKQLDIDLRLDATIIYSEDMSYLKTHVYPLIKSDSLVHTNNHAFHGEHVELIKIPQSDKYDFVGNVIWNNKPKFEYFIGDLFQQVSFLRGHDQFLLCQYLTDSVTPADVPYHSRSLLFDIAYNSNYYLKNIPKCQYWLSQFEFAELTPNVFNNSNYLFKILGKKTVASFDSTREPAEDEVVIVYGNYPDWHHALPCSSKIYRHVSMFFNITHDVVEYDSSWEDVSTIYILNLEDRSDRFSDTLVSLASVRAPLHRIHHYKAKKDGLPPYVGATKNHVDVVKHFVESGNEKCLILEDDIVFIDDQTVWKGLGELSRRSYDYTICFLAISKHGQRQPLDDLLSVSKQSCTTSSAYFLQKSTAADVLNITNEGLELMQTSGDHHNYCIDRYWTKLPNMLFFKKKLAYQRPSFSNLTKQINFHLD
jgi:hypothetical protein